MSTSILVTYASRYGSTEEVAKAIAGTLSEHGFVVDCKPMLNVSSLDAYQAVVFGAPLYIGRWPKDAQKFLTHHQDALRDRPLAIFALGPISSDAEEWEGVRDQLNKQLQAYPWLKPVTHELFGGRYDPAALHFPDSLLTKLPASPLHNLPASDLRDWSAIRQWAMSLVNVLAQRQPIT
jgi:menaquinone-dependent protoporphyrinogen oxidase